jgi:hypothetical protein
VPPHGQMLPTLLKQNMLALQVPKPIDNHIRVRDWQVSKSLRFVCAVPRTYEEDVQRAVWTFRHQRVFCPRQRRVVHLRPLPEAGLLAGAAVPSALAPGDDVLEFLGPPLLDTVACQVAAGGNLHLYSSAEIH